jgi:hypothetical protein
LFTQKLRHLGVFALSTHFSTKAHYQVLSLQMWRTLCYFYVIRNQRPLTTHQSFGSLSRVATASSHTKQCDFQTPKFRSCLNFQMWNISYKVSSVEKIVRLFAVTRYLLFTYNFNLSSLNLFLYVKFVILDIRLIMYSNRIFSFNIMHYFGFCCRLFARAVLCNVLFCLLQE